MIKTLLLSIAFGLALRVIPVWGKVFSPIGVKYNVPDSYFHAEGILRALDGSPVYSIFDVYNQVAAFIIKLSHINPEVMITIIPLAIFAATMPAVYLAARSLFSRPAAVVACFLFAVLPTEYMVRSLLGEPDHHAAEVFGATWLACVIILTLSLKNKKLKYASLFLIAATMTGVIMYIFPLLKSYAVFLNSSYASLTTEVRGIFAYPQAATYIIDVIVAAGLLALVMKKADKRPLALWAFAAWTITAAIMTITQRRFDYYLTPPLAVLCGYGVILVARDLKIHWVAVLSFVLLLTTPIAYYQAQVASMRPTDEWASNLKQLGTQTSGKVMAWWDYGYWIKYYGMIPLVDGGQDISSGAVAAFYLTGNRPAEMDAEYLIINDELVNEFTPALEGWAGIKLDDPEQSFAARLYNGERIDGYKYVMGDKVKIFEVVK